jgi:hypothetical protein
MNFGAAFSKSFRNVFGWFVRILKPPRKNQREGPPTEWTHRLIRMQKCKTGEELLRQFGEPSHKVHTGGLEIWHYPLGLHNGFLYSIHAVPSDNGLNQVYMHTEPGP